jgi:hypothetical protein
MDDLTDAAELCAALDRLLADGYITVDVDPLGEDDALRLRPTARGLAEARAIDAAFTPDGGLHDHVSD